MKRMHYWLLLAGGLWFGTEAGLGAQMYTVSTLAGNPFILDRHGEPLGDYADGTNSQARFNFPQAVAVDWAGTVFVADTFNNSIRALKRVGSNWVVTTVAGSGPTGSGSADGTNGAAQFDMPQGVATDRGGNLYVADMFNSMIRKITPAGSDWVVSTIAGLAGVTGTNDGPGTAARFVWPVSVAVDDATNVYVSDYGTNTIRRLTPEGTNWVVSTIAGAYLPGSADGTNGQARFDGPGSIAADSAGCVYVCDWWNSTIRKLTPVGSNYVVTTIAGKAGHADYVDGTGANARFTRPPGGIGVDSAGTVYVTDAGMVRKVAPAGATWQVTTIAGSYGAVGTADGTGNAVRFHYPQAVAADNAGNLYVADSGNNTIRMGVLPLTTLPPLRIAYGGGQVVLTWPLSAAGFVVERGGALPAHGDWTALTNAVGIFRGHNALTNDPGAGAAIYRLRKQ